jgi:type IV pilus assembly protein PilM
VRTLARGGQQLTELLADRMDVSEKEAEAAKCDEGLDGERYELTRVLTEAMRPLVAEIRTSVQYFLSSNPGAQIDRMSLTGGASSLRGLARTLEAQIGLPTSVVDATQHIRNRESPQHLLKVDGASQLSAVSIGLAMGWAA